MTYWLFIGGGALLMAAVMLIARRHYEISIPKTLLCALLLTAAGVIGAKLMYRLENGGAAGDGSFFGALFLAPPVMALAALALREKPGTVLDLCAPAECAMLALQKVRCDMEGCCYGILLRLDATGRAVRFPSQRVECAAAAVLALALLILIFGEWARGEVYPWYMVLYGVIRFGLNLLRDTAPFVWILPAGNFWSILSAMIGIIWLVLLRRRKKAATA